MWTNIEVNVCGTEVNVDTAGPNMDRARVNVDEAKVNVGATGPYVNGARDNVDCTECHVGNGGESVWNFGWNAVPELRWRSSPPLLPFSACPPGPRGRECREIQGWKKARGDAGSS